MAEPSTLLLPPVFDHCANESDTEVKPLTADMHDERDSDQAGTYGNRRPTEKDSEDLGIRDFAPKLGEGWRKLHVDFKEKDERTMKEYEDDINTLLVFAGLFSAVLTAFTIEIFQRLENDDAETSTIILRRISMQLEGSQANLQPLPFNSTPSSSIVIVNIFWFSSLLLTFLAALFGILAKQWIHTFSKWSEGLQHEEALFLRDHYWLSFDEWKVPEIIAGLPVLLQVALLLFIVGLVIFIWSLNNAVAIVSTIFATTIVIAAVSTIILPAMYDSCPYKTPLGLFFGTSCRRLTGWACDVSSWKHRDIKSSRIFAFRFLRDSHPLEKLVMQLCLVLNVRLPNSTLQYREWAPRLELLSERILDLDEEQINFVSNLLVTPSIDHGAIDKWPLRAHLKVRAYEIHHLFRRLFSYLDATKKGLITRVVKNYTDQRWPDESVASRLSAVRFYSRYTQGEFEEPTIEACVTGLHFAKRAAQVMTEHTSSSRSTDLHDELLLILNYWVDVSQRRLDSGVHESLLSTCKDLLVRVFESRPVVQTTFVTTSDQHKTEVSAVAFSSNQSKLVSGAQDGSIRLWEALTGDSITEFEGHTGAVYSVGFSPDDSLLASGSHDCTVRVWSVSSDAAHAVTRVMSHAGPVNVIVFSPNGCLLASGSRDTTVRLWSPQTGESMGVIKAYVPFVDSIEFLGDSSLVAMLNFETVRIYGTENGGRGLPMMHILEHPGNEIFSAAAFSSEGRWIGTGGGSRGNNIVLWNMESRRPILVPFEHPTWGYVHRVTFTHDSSHLISQDSYGSTRAHDLHTISSTLRLGPTSNRRVPELQHPLFLLSRSGCLLVTDSANADYGTPIYLVFKDGNPPVRQSLASSGSHAAFGRKDGRITIVKYIPSFGSKSFDSSSIS